MTQRWFSAEGYTRVPTRSLHFSIAATRNPSRLAVAPRFPMRARVLRAALKQAGTTRLSVDAKRKTPTTTPDAVSPAELRRQGRLARIAKALASGATVTDIAEAEGISRTVASTVANSPECRQLIAEFVNSEFDEMRALFYRGLRVIEHAMSARREYMTKEGQIIYGGPDHYARLAATKHLRDFLAAGRPAPKQPEKQERRGMTLQELEELVASSEQSRSGVAAAA